MVSIIKKENRIRNENSPTCIAYEYLHGDADINVAEVEKSGRYPDEGVAFNTKSKELVFIKSGEGKIVVEGKEYSLTPGDSVLIQPNEKYFFEGEMALVICCHPAWHKDQHIVSL